MISGKQLALSLVILAILIGACSPKPYLKVKYQLPSTSAVLTGETISLSISDGRKESAFLSNSARKSIKNFDGMFSLLILRDDGSGNLVGPYDVDSLLKEIFRRRLENEGAKVSATAENARARLGIELEEFRLDTAGPKWVLRMSYRASLSGDNGLLAEESVSGSAERMKVVGKTDAEMILGELVTDMVNKLDVATLFQKTQ